MGKPISKMEEYAIERYKVLHGKPLKESFLMEMPLTNTQVALLSIIVVGLVLLVTALVI